MKQIVQDDPLKRFKNTECPFKMSVKITKTGEYPCKIKLHHHHNHAGSKAIEMANYKDIPDDIRNEIRALYKEGKSFMHFFKQDLCLLI